MSLSIKRVCVFCGSREGEDPDFVAEAYALGQKMAKRNLELVFGGGSVGLMGQVANGILDHGGKAHGVIPEHLLRKEVGHQSLTALHITNSMHERKALMEELSDAFIALPGGFGTLEELFETITWIQLNLHRKPLVVLNINGYYNELIDFVNTAVRQGFIYPENKDIFNAAGTIERAFELLGL